MSFSLSTCELSDVPVVSTRKWYQALVASQAGFDRMVITSPNCLWIPEYPRETTVIETFMDGHWGIHEYSLHPQDLCRGWWHLACIPMQHAVPSIVLAEVLDRNADWEPEGGLGFDGLGNITLERQVDLMVAAKDTISACEKLKVPATVRKYTRFLSTILQTFVDRMRHLPASPTVAISVAAHIQRLTLELVGLKNYMQFVVPRLESNRDYSDDVLPFLGAFVREGSDAATLTRVGVPVFFLQPLTHRLAVWGVVESDSRAYLADTRPCDPPFSTILSRSPGWATSPGHGNATWSSRSRNIWVVLTCQPSLWHKSRRSQTSIVFLAILSTAKRSDRD